jgi:hypothetical protein
MDQISKREARDQREYIGPKGVEKGLEDLFRRSLAPRNHQFYCSFKHSPEKIE